MLCFQLFIRELNDLPWTSEYNINTVVRHVLAQLSVGTGVGRLLMDHITVYSLLPLLLDFAPEPVWITASCLCLNRQLVMATTRLIHEYKFPARAANPTPQCVTELVLQVLILCRIGLLHWFSQFLLSSHWNLVFLTWNRGRWNNSHLFLNLWVRT